MHTTYSQRTVRIALLLAIMLTAHASHAGVMTRLHSFSGGTADGNQPVGTIVKSGSSLYGVTYRGGASNSGALFEIGTDGGNFQVVRSFGGGDGNPSTGLAINGSTLYGGTPKRIYSVQPDGGNFQTVAEVEQSTQPRWPVANLLVSGDRLHGIMQGDISAEEAFYAPLAGSPTTNTVYRFDTELNPLNGGHPVGTPAAKGTTVFGVAYNGGSRNDGLIYQYANFPGIGTVFDFGETGVQNPISGVTVVGSTLYGLTNLGGDHSKGTIYKVDTDGSNFQILHSFDRNGPGGTTGGAMVFTGSELIGTTMHNGEYGEGSLFSINLDGSNFQTLYSFGEQAGDGNHPTMAPLVYDYPNIYGATSAGGDSDMGTVWAYNLAAPEPSTFALGALGLLGLAAVARRRRR